MNLLTVGDSFTYGDELSDRTLAWPNLLAERIQYTVNNLGSPGVGNSRIIRTVIENAHSADLIIIAWSHFARIEIADEHGIYDVWPGNAGNLFKGELSYRTGLLTYINKHHSDQYLFSQSLINCILLQSYLKLNNKRYVMLDSFNESYNPDAPRSVLKAQAKHLIEQIDEKYYLGWPDETMMEWTWGCSRGPGGHFLEQGHEIVADKIYEHIRNLSWIS